MGVFAATALIGLAVSLFVRRRRVWVRADTDEAGRTRVEYALLARGEATGLRAENVALRSAMEKMWPVTAPESDNGPEGEGDPAPRHTPGSGV